MYQLEHTQLIKQDIDVCWEFFTDPKNLEKITPKKMGFEILNDPAKQVYPGLIIYYRIRPLFNLPVRWVTEITHISEKQFFVDEQRLGPYKIWHHEHHFQHTDQGVLMTDRVSYVMPFGILGRLVHRLLVRRQLEQIFAYRKEMIERMFNQ